MEGPPLNTAVRFADGFDRPDTIAFGLEGAQLAVVATGAALAWALLHAPAPAGLQVAAAVAVAATCGVAGAGRCAGRPLLTWAWIAGRFWISARRGGGPLLARARDGGGSGGAGTGSGGGAEDGAGAGGVPDGPLPDGGRGDGPGDKQEPSWARWLREGGAAARGGARAGEPRPFVWTPPGEPEAHGDPGPIGSGWTYGTSVHPEPRGEVAASGGERPAVDAEGGGGIPSFVLQPRAGGPSAGPGEPRGPADVAASQRSAAVEMWLAALGGGRVAAAGSRQAMAGPGALDLAAVGVRDQLGGAVRAGTPPLPLVPTAADAVAPSPLGAIARRVRTRLRRGRPVAAAEAEQALPPPPPDPSDRLGGPLVGDPPSGGQMIEIDRPPLVVIGGPAAASDADADADAAAAPRGSGADEAEVEDPAGVGEPLLGTVIPLVHRFNDALDEELMRELAGSGDGDPAPRQSLDRSPAASATATGERSDAARTPVFVGATRRICFFSLNGGSGRTTLATEVACLLAARGRHRPDPQRPPERLRVALVDLDMRSSNVAVRLGIPRPTIWDYLLATGAEADDVRRFLVSHPSGLRALLGPPKPLSTAAAAVEPARIAEIVHQLERDGCHFVVFDLGSDLGAVSTWVLGQVHDIYVVITATGSGLQDAYRTTETLRRLGLGHKLRYVVNRARGSVDVDEVMSDLGGRVVATVPYDHRLEDAENAHRIASLQGGGPAAQAIVRLASTIYPTIGEPRPRRGLIGRRHAG